MYCFRGFELEPDGGGMFFFKLVDGLACRGNVIGPFKEIVVTPNGIWVSDIDFWWPEMVVPPPGFDTVAVIDEDTVWLVCAK